MTTGRSGIGEARVTSRNSATERVAAEAPILVVLALGATVVLRGLVDALGHDSWLALLAGREIAEHGLPRHETLTVVAGGREWVDQAWLGQLAIYGLHTAGGLKLALFAHAAVLVLALVAAVGTSRALGASPLVAALGGLLAFRLLPASQVLRTQTFALLLFALLLYLLCREASRPSRRVYLALPLLVLWANVHGSVLVGAAVAVGFGVCDGARRFRRGDPPRSFARPLALALAPPFAVLASPYELSLVGYYRQFLSRTDILAELGGEWARPTLVSSPLLFATVLIGAALLARRDPRLTMFDRVVWVVVSVAALGALRSGAWLALAAAAILPRAIPARPAEALGRAPLRIAAVAVAATVFALASAAAASRPEAGYRAAYPAPAAASVAALVEDDATRTVFAHWALADWLMFEQPGLVGRVASDIRFELLTGSELRATWRFYRQDGWDWQRPVDGHRVVVLNRRWPRVERALLAEAGTRRVLSNPRLTVLVRADR